MSTRLVTRSAAAWSLALATQLILVTAPTVAQSPLPSQLPSMSPSASPTGIAVVSSAADASTEVVLSDFAIEPTAIEVSSDSWTFAVTNEGITPHNLSIRDATGELAAATPTLSQGESAVLTVDLAGEGPYTYFCSLPGHESLGMSGQLIRTDSLESPAPSGS